MNFKISLLCSFLLCTISSYGQIQLSSIPHEIFEAEIGTQNWGPFPKSGKFTQADKKYKIDFAIPKGEEMLFLYTDDNQKTHLKSAIGIVFGGKYNKTEDRFFEEEFYFLPLQFGEDSLNRFTLTVQNTEGLLNVFSFLSSSERKPNLKSLEIYTEIEFLKKVDAIRSKDKVTRNLINLFIGALGFTSIFVFLLFFLNGLKEFLYYGLYLFSYFVFGIFHTRFYSKIGLWIGNAPLLHQNLPESFIWIGMCFYGFFAIHLLQINRQEHPKLLFYLESISWYSLFCAVIIGSVSVLFNNQTWNDAIFTFIRITYSPLGAVGIVWILIKVKSKLSWILALGISLWAILGNYSSFFAVNEGYELTSISNGNNSAIFWVIVGLLSESIMFSTALGFRIKMSEDERSKNKEALIEKLSEIKVLKEQENEILEKKVTEKTTELLKTKAVIEEQKQLQIKQTYEKRIAISEMNALRSQMNPHFIFNSLSSIKHLILTDQKEKSSVYLNKFAKLLRQVLIFSRANKASLYEELENIKTYLELESERFGDFFEFDIAVGKLTKDDLSLIEIPPLLLQPFVENAILHGLRNSPNNPKKIIIEVIYQKDYIDIIILDNGIGREKAQELKPPRQESLGTKITDERIQLYNETFKSNISYMITDLEIGTLVKVRVQ